MSDQLVWVDLYQDTSILARITSRPQKWRWRARNGLNNRILASGESYTNRADALNAIHELFGPETDVYLRSSREGNVALRLNNAT
jgi:uncharacterized protein YegP (UPF0339 family)